MEYTYSSFFLEILFWQHNSFAYTRKEITLLYDKNCDGKPSQVEWIDQDFLLAQSCQKWIVNYLQIQEK